LNRSTLWMVFVVFGLASLACGPARPAAEAWKREWRNALALSASVETSDDAGAACHSLLAELRRDRNQLMPTPDESLDGVVERWIRMAEGLGFDCPRAKGNRREHEKRLRELRVLEAEISAGVHACAQRRTSESSVPPVR